LIRECLLCAPGWGLNSREVGDALAVVSHPMLVLADCNTHSQSWGCDSKDSSARAVQSLFDGLNLVHLNDGTLTRIAAPPLNVPTNLPIPIFDLSRHISWSVYADAMLDSLDTAAREEVDVEKRPLE
jgi:hypothetical protein